MDANTKRLTATGYVPNSTTPIATRVVKTSMYINTASVAFNFGVQVGDGGLAMSNNSQVNGNVFSNGSITGSNGSVITGDASVGAGVAANTDQQCTTASADYSFANNDSTKRDVSQKFTPTVSGSLNKISVYINKNGSPSNLTVRIMPHNSTNNEPQRTGQLGSNGSFASIGSTYGWIDASFTTAPTVTAGTSYWIVLDGSTNSSSNYYTVAVDGAYACSGNGKYASSYSTNPPNWQAIIGGSGADLNFKTYVGGTTNTLSGVTVNGSARAQAMSGCTIGGNAYFEDISTNCSVSGSQNPAIPAPSPQAMPISSAQITDWKTEAENGGVSTGNYSVSGTQTLGPLKIAGNLTVTNGAALNVSGSLWVTGTISFSNNAIVRVASSLGSNGTMIVADGTISVSNNVTITGSGSPNSYLLLLTTATGSGAMNLGNNGSGAIFYAANGTLNVSNNAGGNQLTGYAISMSNNSVVTYSSGLQSATFSTGPGGSWSHLPGSYVIVR